MSYSINFVFGVILVECVDQIVWEVSVMFYSIKLPSKHTLYECQVVYILIVNRIA